MRKVSIPYVPFLFLVFLFRMSFRALHCTSVASFCQFTNLVWHRDRKRTETGSLSSESSAQKAAVVEIYARCLEEFSDQPLRPHQCHHGKGDFTSLAKL